jgi:hypothetical protein
VDNVASSLGAAGSWEPADTRPEGMRLASMGSKHQFLLCHLTPDWPAVTAGGCCYFHTARSWLLDRLPTLAALDSEFWLVNYTEIDLFITLGRDVPPRPSPRDPTSSPRLTYNPECTGGALTLLADQINKERFTSLVAPYRPKRVILIEYVLAHPDQAALLLLKLESNRTFAHQLFCTDRKIRKLMAELRSTLSAVGALPRRPDDWVDPLPSGNPASGLSAQLQGPKKWRLWPSGWPASSRPTHSFWSRRSRRHVISQQLKSWLCASPASSIAACLEILLGAIASLPLWGHVLMLARVQPTNLAASSPSALPVSVFLRYQHCSGPLALAYHPYGDFRDHSVGALSVPPARAVSLPRLHGRSCVRGAPGAERRLTVSQRLRLRIPLLPAAPRGVLSR